MGSKKPRCKERLKGLAYKIEAIDIGFFNPSFKLIGYLNRRANRGCAETAQGQVSGDSMLSPVLDGG